MGQVDITLVGYHHVVPDHALQSIFDLLAAQLLFQLGDLFIEQKQGALDQFFGSKIEMSFFIASLLQSIEQRPLHPHRVVRIAAGLLYDGINAFESEPGYLAQAVWTLPQQLHAVRSKMLIDLQRGDWSYLERCQQRHQIPHGLALRIPGLDILQPFLRDAFDLQKPFRLPLQDIQCVDTEPLHDGIRGLLSDPFQESGGQIAPDAFKGGRHDLAPVFHLKLASVLSVLPHAVQFYLDGVGARQVISHCCKTNEMIAVPVGALCVRWYHVVRRFKAQDAVFVRFIEKQHLIKGGYNTHFFLHLRFLSCGRCCGLFDHKFAALGEGDIFGV